jgi:hypothetical protein
LRASKDLADLSERRDFSVPTSKIWEKRYCFVQWGNEVWNRVKEKEGRGKGQIGKLRERRKRGKGKRRGYT